VNVGVERRWNWTYPVIVCLEPEAIGYGVAGFDGVAEVIKVAHGAKAVRVAVRADSDRPKTPAGASGPFDNAQSVLTHIWVNDDARVGAARKSL